MNNPPVIRYGIYWVSLDPTKGREIQKCRPCVVVSPDFMHQTNMAVVCPCTTAIHARWAHRIQVNFNGRDNEVMPDQIRAVSLDRFDGYIGTLNPNAVTRLCDVIVKLYTLT
ncbi:MAG TPA: type II toxin-antitoxin system PemK/MazF family toxin [Chthoniobacterales bacterium]